MRIPYIRIKQRDEVFFITKFNAAQLLDRVDFHFREPYSDLDNREFFEKKQNYIDRIKKLGIDLQSNEEGIQRRLQIERIKSISDYIQDENDNFLPNSILLSVDVSRIPGFEEMYLQIEEKEIGYFHFPENIRFSIIDGQHRLAGLSLVAKEILSDFEITTILLINVSKPTAAKLFSDINGKQKAVNKSLIYDLYQEVDEKAFNKIKKFHSICRSFYSNIDSPLFRQIKMLGIGSGAISQAFFIDYSIDSISKTSLINQDEQKIFDQLFYYFKVYQRLFPEDWPVPLKHKSIQEVDDYSHYVLKVRKSQLVKTNGFGAILRIFPKIYLKSNNSYDDYFKIIQKLKGNIQWVPNENVGTGKAFQNFLVSKIENIIFN